MLFRAVFQAELSLYKDIVARPDRKRGLAPYASQSVIRIGIHIDTFRGFHEYCNFWSYHRS